MKCMKLSFGPLSVMMTLVLIGCLFVLPCLGQQTGREHLSKLMTKLSSHEEKVWREAVLPLAQMGAYPSCYRCKWVKIE